MTHVATPSKTAIPTVLAFGVALKRARRAAHLTQAQLAERAGFSVVYISMLERGARQPQPSTVTLLVEALVLPGAERVALEHAVTIIWSSDPAAVIYLDGSYVTDKVDPVDVDLAVRSDIWTDSLFLSAFTSAYPGEETLVDFYFNTKQSAQRMEELFREIQGQAAKKGIIYLIP